MAKLCEGRVCLVTGAGRGIGREHALMLAEHGAKVVVNDLGGDRRGESGEDDGPAHQAVAEIVEAGGEAIADGGNVADFAEAKAMVDLAINTYGRLDVVINNAGILRDRMLVNMTEAEWDAVIAGAPEGHVRPGPPRRPALARAVQGGRGRSTRRIINTTSPSGIYGNVGQTNYGAAKAGHRVLHDHRRQGTWPATA
jgi:NAD(P)-dependent dehydrogenase (short-subunit alcohol dehydrogenase family)